MRICLVGKYPPIEGVVSAETYWTARELASKGHSVFVVTNAEEVEPCWRIQMTAKEYSSRDYAWNGGPSGGKVSVFSSEGANPSTEYHIPFTNPCVTRLAAMATDIIRSEKCDVIYAFYLEPYAVAAHLASHWTGVPYVVKHSGTDLFRLARSPSLRTTYVEVLKHAERVISSGGIFSELIACGARPERIVSGIDFGVPTKHFHPAIEPIDPTEFIGWNDYGSFSDKLNPSWPIIGIYGKLGEKKGSFDLLFALAQLAGEGVDFHLVAASHGSQEDRFRDLIQDLKLDDRVRIWPFLPCWRVPSFIRLCTVVAILERGFEIAAHTPVTPREVIACATCLVISAELTRRQPFRNQMRNGRNIVVVRSPEDHSSLADAFRYVLDSRDRALNIGYRSSQELCIGGSWERTFATMESLLKQVADHSAADLPRPIGRELQSFRQLFPITYALLRDANLKKLGAQLRDLVATNGSTSQRVLELYSDAVAISLREDSNRKLTAEVFRYELTARSWGLRYESLLNIEGAGILPFPGDTDSLVPSFACDYSLEAFQFNLQSANCLLKADQISLPDLEGSTRILFSSRMNPQIVGDAVQEIIDLVRPGVLSLGELKMRVSRDHPDRVNRMYELVDSVVERFYWAGVVTLNHSPSFLNDSEVKYSAN